MMKLARHLKLASVNWLKVANDVRRNHCSSFRTTLAKACSPPDDARALARNFVHRNYWLAMGVCSAARYSCPFQPAAALRNRADIRSTASFEPLLGWVGAECSSHHVWLLACTARRCTDRIDVGAAQSLIRNYFSHSRDFATDSTGGLDSNFDHILADARTERYFYRVPWGILDRIAEHDRRRIQHRSKLPARGSFARVYTKQYVLACHPPRHHSVHRNWNGCRNGYCVGNGSGRGNGRRTHRSWLFAVAIVGSKRDCPMHSLHDFDWRCWVSILGDHSVIWTHRRAMAASALRRGNDVADRFD